jgi:hypothetical protein
MLVQKIPCGKDSKSNLVNNAQEIKRIVFLPNGKKTG